MHILLSLLQRILLILVLFDLINALVENLSKQADHLAVLALFAVEKRFLLCINRDGKLPLPEGPAKSVVRLSDLLDRFNVLVES